MIAASERTSERAITAAILRHGKIRRNLSRSEQNMSRESKTPRFDGATSVAGCLAGWLADGRTGGMRFEQLLRFRWKRTVRRVAKYLIPFTVFLSNSMPSARHIATRSESLHYVQVRNSESLSEIPLAHTFDFSPDLLFFQDAPKIPPLSPVLGEAASEISDGSVERAAAHTSDETKNKQTNKPTN